MSSLVSARRAFTPDRAVGTLLGWWKADTLVLADGAAVAAWGDSSAAGHGLSQATTARRPVYAAAGIGGKPAVRFTNVDHSLISGAFNVSTSCTVFAVVKAASNAPSVVGYICDSQSTNVNSRRGIFQGATTGKWGFRGSLSVSQANAFDATIPSIVAGVFNGTSSSVEVTATPTTGDPGVVNALTTGLTIGNRSTFDGAFTGWIAEIIVFDGTLSSSDTERVKRYLAAKYSVERSVTNVLYVDSVTGTSGADGLLRTRPKLTLNQAQAALTAGSPGLIRVKAPVTTPLRESLVLTGADDISLEPSVLATRWYLYGSVVQTSGWASVGGGIYTKTLTGLTDTIPMLVVPTLTQTVGDRSDFFLKLAKNITTPTTPAAGEFGVVGATDPVCYIHLPAGADPNTHTVEVPKQTSPLFARGLGTLSAKYGVVRFSAGNGILIGISSATAGMGNAYGEDMALEYNAVDGAEGLSHHTWSKFVRCTSFRNSGDGFGVHSIDGWSPLMELVDCEGSYNGDKPGDSAQGASPHETTRMLLTRFTAKYNSGGNVVAVNSARLDVVDLVSDHAMRDGGISQAGLTYNDTTTGSVDGATITNTVGGPGLKVAATAVVGPISRVTSGTGQGNAQADNLAA